MTLSKQKAHAILRKAGLANGVDYTLWPREARARTLTILRLDRMGTVCRSFWKEGWAVEVAAMSVVYLVPKPALTAEEVDAFDGILHDAARGDLYWKDSPIRRGLGAKGLLREFPRKDGPWYELTTLGRMVGCGLQIDRDAAGARN